MKKQQFSRFMAALLLIVMTTIPVIGTAANNYIAGTYTGSASGMMGEVSVTMVFDESNILSVDAVGANETVAIATPALEQLPGMILAAQSTDVDMISGATVTSKAILEAAEKCIAQAKGEKLEEEAPIPTEADVIVIGGGTSGLAAAAAAGECGASVIVLEANSHVGGAAILSGGTITYENPEFLIEFGRNDDTLAKYESYQESDFPDDWKNELVILKKEVAEYLNSDRVDAFSSIARMMVDHYVFSYGVDLDGVPVELDYAYTKAAFENNQDIGKWLLAGGMTIKPYSNKETPYYVGPTRKGNELIEVQLKMAEDAGAYVVLNMRAVDLIMENGKISKVEALDSDGNSVMFTAKKGVVLAPGGFSANPKMCAQYQNVGTGMSDTSSTTNPVTNRGDGIIMATKFDAQLRNMQYIGLGPADYLNGPSKAEASLALTASQLVVNSNAKRFWKGTTDTSVNNSKKMTYIAANQPDAISYFIGDAKMSNYMESNNPGIVEKLKNRGILFMADTLEQLASQINVDANSLTETITAFNGYVDAGIDPDFGRTEFNGKVEAGPYIAFKDQIAYHLTFGGLVTNTEAEVLDTQGAPIPGLYAAGDVTSGIEGTTHRTGDCLLACVYYGKVAGENAAGL